MADVTFKGTPFKEAIDFFQAKVRVPTRTYTDMMNKAHSKGFMVAGACWRTFRRSSGAVSGTV